MRLKKPFLFLIGLIASWMLMACAPSNAEIEKSLVSAMQQTFNSDPNFKGYEIKVISVSVAKSDGNNYKGLATIKPKLINQMQIPITVTADSSGQVLWQSEPGAFANLLIR